ncbi:MAG: MotA/TolQ/ExbB proton channel family protein [Candidatus Brocadiaceae bacterium]|nr:MotA/TolQ/ExbB proton channel family protein [Candidatus Brocadiaceae bacterium]
MKRKLNNILIIVSASLTFAAALAWYNNLSIAMQWAPVNIQGVVYRGSIPWLDWCCVDFSTISTFIPFFGFLLITLGFVRTARPEKREPSETFPFFKMYISFTIALGLIGTVWGLIMIGYYDLDQVTIKELIYCLRTALYSTLIALVWVFIFAQPINTAMKSWHRIINGQKTVENEDFLQLVTELGSAISDAGNNLRQTTTEVSGLKDQASHTKNEFLEIIHVLGEFKKRTGIDVHKAVQDSCDKLSKTAEEFQKLLLQIWEEHKHERYLRDEMEKRLQNALEDKQEAENQIKQAFSEKIKAEQLAQSAMESKQIAEMNTEKTLSEKKAAEHQARLAMESKHAAEIQASQSLLDKTEAENRLKTTIQEYNKMKNQLRKIGELSEKSLTPKGMEIKEEG